MNFAVAANRARPFVVLLNQDDPQTGEVPPRTRASFALVHPLLVKEVLISSIVR